MDDGFDAKAFVREAEQHQQQAKPPELDISKLCLTPAAWEARTIDPEDKLLGPFSTTTRTEISADTGLGKTMLGLGRAHAIRLGEDFMHWKGHRQGRALYIDGEMPPELTQQRVKLARSWFSVGEPITDGLFILSRFDVEGMPPLDTTEGARWLLNFIEKLGKIDDITFDNRASLSAGDQSGDDASSNALKHLQREITTLCIGQLWLHHTGYETTRGYGRKSREWELDTVAVGERLERRIDVDVAMKLTFKKARRRTPENRADYEPVEIELRQGELLWHPIGGEAQSDGKPMGTNQKIVFDQAIKLIAGSTTKAPPSHPANGHTVISVEMLRDETKKVLACEARQFASRFNAALNGLTKCGRLSSYDGYVWNP